MNDNDLKYMEKIRRLKEEKNATILAHNYQIPEIQDLGDFVGDSLGLAMEATGVDSELVVMCGVDFMAETVKILNPEKRVLIPSLRANCPMARQLSRRWLDKGRERYPDAGIVLYVNTSAEEKAFADSCCTSANAAKVVNALDSATVLFGPDRNLAYYVNKRTDKTIVPIPPDGHCYVHRKILGEYVERAREEHPDAEIIVHPECNPEVQDMADGIESTSGMLRRARSSDRGEFIIGTEVGLLYRLRKENPGKKFWPACDKGVCYNQKSISLENLMEALEGEQFEVSIPDDISGEAVRAIDRMLEIGRDD